MLRWEIFQRLYDRLKQNNVHKHAKIRIVFSTKNKERKIKECTFQGLLMLLWSIYEDNDFVTIIISIIKDNNVQPIFKYTIANKQIENKPKNTGNEVIKYWKDMNPKARKIYTNITALKIQEEMDERFNI